MEVRDYLHVDLWDEPGSLERIFSVKKDERKMEVRDYLHVDLWSLMAI